MRAAVHMDAQLWNVYTEGDQYVIPYKVGQGMPQHLMDSILNAAYELENNTCLRLKPYQEVQPQNQGQYLNFINNLQVNCKSLHGRKANNNVSVWLKSGLKSELKSG